MGCPKSLFIINISCLVQIQFKQKEMYNFELLGLIAHACHTYAWYILNMIQYKKSKHSTRFEIVTLIVSRTSITADFVNQKVNNFIRNDSFLVFYENVTSHIEFEYQLSFSPCATNWNANTSPVLPIERSTFWVRSSASSETQGQIVGMGRQIHGQNLV